MAEVQRRLGCPVAVEVFGHGSPPPSAWGNGSVRGREIYVVANGGFYILRVGLEWPSFPQDATVGWAPVGYPIRDESEVMGGPRTASTHDALFDAVYLIVGDSAPRVADALTPAARKALLDYQELAPSISGQVLTYHSPMAARRTNVESRPPLSATPEKVVQIGNELFTARQAAQNVDKLIALAEALEASQCDLL